MLMMFTSQKERQTFWLLMCERYSPAEIEEALLSLQRDTLRVLQLHYLMKYPLKDIAKIMNKSMTTVRNHNARGIVKLRKFFERKEGKPFVIGSD